MKQLIGILNLKYRGSDYSSSAHFRLKVYEKECGSVSYTLLNGRNMRCCIGNLQCDDELPMHVYKHEYPLYLLSDIMVCLDNSIVKVDSHELLIDTFRFKHQTKTSFINAQRLIESDEV
tara:strand:+ start:980 stop:1336 length:357 start_codon:yes stop_codon:yes gene_type:complete